MKLEEKKPIDSEKDWFPELPYKKDKHEKLIISKQNLEKFKYQKNFVAF